MRLLFISPNNVYATNRLLEECSKQGVEVAHFSSADLLAEGDIDIEHFDALYVRFAYPHFGEIVALAKKFKAAGKTVVDEVIAEGDIDPDKLEDNKKLLKAGLSVPLTSAFNDNQTFEYPLVLKTKYGFGKKEVFLVNHSRELEAAIEKFPLGDFLVQEFIPAKYEYKVICAGYKTLPKVLRFKINPSGFGINGMECESRDADECERVVQLAEEASRVLGRELSKVDILQMGKEYFVLEVNRSPGLRSFENISGINAAGYFTNYLKEKAIGRKP